MRHTQFRALMDAHFGPQRAPSVAQDHVFSALGGRTPDQAIAAGIPPRTVWRAVCEEFEVPPRLHHGLPD